jgi:hypothetical protein
MKPTPLYFYSIIIMLSAINYSQMHEIQKLIPDNKGAWFGCSVAIDGNYAIVGCPLDSTNGTASGAAYIFKNNIVEWELVAKIIGSDVNENDLFGTDVAIDGDFIVVGAPHSGQYWEGAAYIFQKQSSGAWIEHNKLTADNPSQQFGTSISVSGSRIVVGTVQEKAYIFFITTLPPYVLEEEITLNDPHLSYTIKSVTIYGDLVAIGDPWNSEMGNNAGAVFIFERLGGSVWQYRQKLIPIFSQGTQDNFGRSLSFDDNFLVVGATHHFDIDSVYPYGTVYIFKRDTTYYRYSTRLSKSGALPNDAFGQSVDISNNFLLVGALNTPGPGHGYLYHYDGNNWNQMPDTIKSGDFQTGDQFGADVSLSGDYIIIGAYGHNPIGMYAKGAAYLFIGLVTSNEELITEIPLEFYLRQNYPNPFNPSTTIKWQMPETGFVTLKIYDVLGREVTTLVNEELTAGKHEKVFDASLISSGVYFYQLKAGSFIEIKKMILIR